VLEVVGVSENGVKLKSAAGKVGAVTWGKLADKKSGRALLGYGDCLTVHSAQGSTADEHITALPRGSSDLSGQAAYSSGTRHRQASFLITSALAEYVEVKAGRARNDVRQVTDDDRFANIARNLSREAVKENATDLRGKTSGLRHGTVRAFQESLQPAEHRKSLGQAPSDGPEIVQRQQIERVPVLQQAIEMARDWQRTVAEQAIEAARRVHEAVREHGRSMGMGR